MQYILQHFCEFRMYCPLILYGRHVWCSLKKNITLIYKVRYKFFVRLYIDTRCIMPQQAALLSLWSDSQVHMCATFQSSSLYTDWHHISYRYTVCCNLFFSEYAWHCFPLECQCYGCVVNMYSTICLNSKFKSVRVLLDELPRNFYVFSRTSFISPNNASRMNVAW